MPKQEQREFDPDVAVFFKEIVSGAYEIINREHLKTLLFPEHELNRIQQKFLSYVTRQAIRKLLFTGFWKESEF